ncbi:MAG: polysaccharide deacetylase family protein [Solirubrobacterales bacterium]|nr:polysaccharide deacetylase family protein [Solirubrobacterales bacterium]
MRAKLLGIKAVIALVLAATALVAGPVALAQRPSGGPRRGGPRSSGPPPTVVSASLTQSGQLLVFSVKLSASFSPRVAKRLGRSLCLLVERRSDGAVTDQLCVIPPAADGRRPRLVHQQVRGRVAGRAMLVAATVTRPSPSELTATFLPQTYGARTYAPIRWQARSALAAARCASGRRGPPGCASVFPATATLVHLRVPRIAGCIASGPAYVTNGPRSVHELALTFDDGPWYDTPQFLSVLERYDVPATFFEIGDQISTYGQGGAVERRMLADGDMIGDHTWNHADVAGGGSFARGEIESAAAAIRQATRGFTPCLFRAPGGAVSGSLISLARSLGFTTIQWDVDPRDWSRPGVGAIYHTVTSTAHNGSIIIQHDGGGDRSETLAALPQEIATFKREGYRFVTVTQLLGQRLIYR